MTTIPPLPHDDLLTRRGDRLRESFVRLGRQREIDRQERKQDAHELNEMTAIAIAGSVFVWALGRLLCWY